VPRWFMITSAVIAAQLLLAWLIGARLHHVAQDYPGAASLDRLRQSVQAGEEPAAQTDEERKQG
jgi:hypothetical protein